MAREFKVGQVYRWASEMDDPDAQFTITEVSGSNIRYIYADGAVSAGSLIGTWFNDAVEVNTEQLITDDVVNPTHYNGTEVLDQMILIYGLEAVKGFCICNAYKYRQRAGKKSNRIEDDINKALWYEAKYKELGT